MDRNLSRSQIKIEKSVNFKSWIFGSLAAFVLGFIAMTFLPKDPILQISSYRYCFDSGKKSFITFCLLIPAAGPAMLSLL